MRWVRRKEGWLQVADGVKALAEASKGFRTLDWKGVKSAIAWETRQNNQGYWELQVLSFRHN